MLRPVLRFEVGRDGRSITKESPREAVGGRGVLMDEAVNGRVDISYHDSDDNASARRCAVSSSCFCTVLKRREFCYLICS